MPSLDTIPQITQDFAQLKQLLYDTVLELKAQAVLEIGTDVGDSTRIFATALRETGGHLWTVDLVAPKWPEGWLTPYPNVTLLTCDSLLLPWEVTVDLLFLDGNHDKDHVAQELEKFGKWVRSHGQILVHDTIHNEFGEGIRSVAVEYARQHGYGWMNHQIQHGLGVIDVR